MMIERYCSSKNIILLLTFFTSILCFLPLIIGLELDLSHSASDNLHLIERIHYTTSVVVTFLLYEILTECITSTLSKVMILPRTVIVISYFLTCWIFYGFDSFHTLYRYSICSLFFNSSIILGTLFYQLVDNFEKQKHYIPILTIFFLQVSFNANIWLRFTDNFDHSLRYVLLVSQFFSVGCVIFCTFYSLIRIPESIGFPSLKILFAALRDDHKIIQFTNCFLITLYVLMHLGVTIYCADDNSDHRLSIEISLRNIVDLVLLALISQIPKIIIYRQKLSLQVSNFYSDFISDIFR